MILYVHSCIVSIVLVVLSLAPPSDHLFALYLLHVFVFVTEIVLCIHLYVCSCIVSKRPVVPLLAPPSTICINKHSTAGVTHF